MHVAPALTAMTPAPDTVTPARWRNTGIKVIAVVMLVFSLFMAVSFWQYQDALPRRLHEAAVGTHSRAVYERLQTDLQLAERLLHALGLAATVHKAPDKQPFMQLAKGLSPGLASLQALALAQSQLATGSDTRALPANLFRIGDALDVPQAEWDAMSAALAQHAEDAAQRARISGRLTLLGPMTVGRTHVLAIAQVNHEGTAYVVLVDMDKWLHAVTSPHAQWVGATLRVTNIPDAPKPRSPAAGLGETRFNFDNLSPQVMLLVASRPMAQTASTGTLGAACIALLGGLISWLILLLGTRGNEAAASATRAGKALSDSDDRLQRALQLTRDGVWEYDLKKRALYLSGQVLALVGWDDDKEHAEAGPPGPMALLRMLPRHWRREILRTIASAAGKPVTRELKFPVGDAMLSSHWMRLRVRATPDAAGKPWLITGSLADISEEVAQTNAQDRYRALLMRILDAMPIPVAVKTADQQVVMLNERYATQLMATLETMMARSTNGFAERMEELDQVAIATGEPQVAYEWLKTGGGTTDADDSANNGEIYLRITRVLCDGLNGEPIVLGTYEDLTELQRQAQQQSALREYFEKVFDCLPSPTYIKDANHRYILTNQAHARVNKTTKEEMIGKRSADYSPDEADEVEAAERYLLLTGSDEIHEKEYFLNSGNMQRNTIIRKVRITDPAGNPVLLGTSSNVTSLREAEADLRQQAEQQSRLRKFLQDVFDAVPHPLFVKDRHHRYIMTNHAHAESVGARMEEIIGKRSADFVSEEVACGIEASEEALFSGASTASVEYAYVLKHHSGQTHRAVIRKALRVDANGEPVIVGVIMETSAPTEDEPLLAPLSTLGNTSVSTQKTVQDSTSESEG